MHVAALLERSMVWQSNSLTARNEHLAAFGWPKLWPGHEFEMQGQVLILFCKNEHLALLSRLSTVMKLSIWSNIDLACESEVS